MTNCKSEINAAMAGIAKRKTGRSRLVYDKKTGTIRVKGQHGEDKGEWIASTTRASE